MTNLFHRRPGGNESPEGGYVLLAVLFMVVLLLIALAIAAPQIAKSIQRDKEAELVHRGEQYKRAIKLYYGKFGAYPTSIDQLENTNQVRFLRKRYKDPMTGKDDWKMVYFGQAHVHPLGFFGQPLSAVGTAVTAASGAVGGAGGNMYAPPPVTDGGSNSLGGSMNGANSLGGGTNGTNSFGSSTLGSGSSLGGMNSSGTTSGFGSPAGGASSTPGSPSTANPAGTPPASDGSSTQLQGATSGLALNAAGSGSSFGSGGPIVGVAIPSTKASIKEYKKQKHYNEWEFDYDPIEDQAAAASLFGGGTQNVNGTSGTGSSTLGGPSTSGTGTGTPGSSGSAFGSGFGSSGTGSATGMGSPSGNGTSGNPPSTNSPTNPPQ